MPVLEFLSFFFSERLFQQVPTTRKIKQAISPARAATSHSWLCDPSHIGLWPECLQPHHAIVFASVTSTFCGAKPLPLCEPSQNGCDFDRPQAHHQYVPGSTFWT